MSKPVPVNRALPGLPPAYGLAAYDSLGSTNDEAKRLARDEGAAHGTLVWALRQTEGRGRRGRPWISPEGNLYASLVLRPGCTPASAAQLSFVTAGALADTLQPLLPEGICQCKWPNDVLLDDRKAAGILLESETDDAGNIEWLVVGVGINVQHYPQESEFPATSLRNEGGRLDEPGPVLVRFVQAFSTWYDVWKEEGFTPVREGWLQLARGIGGPIAVRLADRTLNGIFADLDEDGALLLDLDTGERRRITAGDVFFPGLVPSGSGEGT
ncbi:biotin--[acetyl-CoA-carboxylase] ligase [Skermanella mucosa]|uniref:biotin--[acetyl-CoA-carboxylase] ligase n=1 Tax=Skermanella mucosa TaxID=1789672 RepID=UPI00192A860F|nr:biotin--[acetyl-CoA-carboxylase] ligase [Skermanella mucosa]UEM23913.1 biotin--[acetyl-CoA-carboxylase] ligase [Skermanella mucosa]